MELNSITEKTLSNGKYNSNNTHIIPIKILYRYIAFVESLIAGDARRPTAREHRPIEFPIEITDAI